VLASGSRRPTRGSTASVNGWMISTM
jgi:hypothetical protein